MLKTRHDFIKRIYKDYIIIYIKNNNYYIYNYEFLSLFKDKLNIINKLNKYHINYIIIDNMNIISKIIFNNNKYNYYKTRFMIYKGAVGKLNK